MVLALAVLGVSRAILWLTSSPKSKLDLKRSNDHNPQKSSKVAKFVSTEVTYDMAPETPKNANFVARWRSVSYLSIDSKVIERSSFKSADVYSDLTIGLALKNYPKMTPHMLKSVHWFKSYGEVFFHVSWCVQWPDHWIGLEKLPHNDPSYAKICPLVPELWCGEWSVLSYSSPLIFHPCGGI